MKKITREELDQILQQHQLLLGSDGANGKRANLYDTNLIGADLRGVNLRRADLRHANLRHANLRHANLRGANLGGAKLQSANLQDANLCFAYLRGGDLRRARFSTNIRDCSNFSDAQFTSDALPWLILHPRWAELKDTVRIEVE